MGFRVFSGWVKYSQSQTFQVSFVQKSALVISSRSKLKFVKNNHVLLNELLQLYFCMCLNFDRKCSKWPWLPQWYLPRVVFCILFHIFQPLINFLRDQTSWASSHFNCPTCYFIITQLFTSLSHFNTIIHLAIALFSLLVLSPEYLHVPWVQRKRSSMILSLLYMVYGLCLSFQFTRNGLAEELQLVWTIKTLLHFSGAAMVYTSRRPRGLQLLLLSSGAETIF